MDLPRQTPFQKGRVAGIGVSEAHNVHQIRKDLINAVWTHMGRSSVGFVGVRDTPSSFGSGTLIRFGDVVGVLTCGHVLEAVLKQPEIGLLCFPVRAGQIQTLRLPVDVTDHILLGTAPWTADGPDLAFLRLPSSIMGDVERVATIANGDRHRQNIISGDPANSTPIGVLGGVVNEMTSPPVITQMPDAVVATTTFQVLVNIGNIIVDDVREDRFRFQPIASPGMPLPTSYKGTSGGGLWKFFLNQRDFSIVQARLVGVVYWEKPVKSELHLLGHGQVSIYQTLFNTICWKWI